MNHFARFVARHRGGVVVAWVVFLAVAAVLAQRLPGVLQGGADAIPGSESDQVTRVLREQFGAGTLYQSLVVLHSDSVLVDDPAFLATAGDVASALESTGRTRSVRTYWNTGRTALLGRDQHSALMLVTPDVRTYFEAELLTPRLREAIGGVRLPAGFRVRLTGSTAMLYDLDHDSSADLLAAERIGLPVTLVVLLIVFGSPLAALMPLVLALAAVMTSVGLLAVLGRMISVSVFAENVVSMIGLGVGVDYSLFILSRYRRERGGGADAGEAIVAALRGAGEAVLFSGVTVGVGFLALFLVRAPFLHAIALGGLAVVFTAVAASLTLLPALVSFVAPAIDWPRRPTAGGATRGGGPWGRWAHLVMRRPWTFIVIATAVLAVFVAPVARLQRWNIGARDLSIATESRQGYEDIAAGFGRGWMGPLIVVLRAPPGPGVWEARRRAAVLATARRLARDPRVDRVEGFASLLESFEGLDLDLAGTATLPATVRPLAHDVVTGDGRVALLIVLPHSDPESPEAMRLLADLRRSPWPELRAAGIEARLGGTTAVMADFDHELFGSLPRVACVVLGLTFVVLMLMFRSLLIPLKATVLNLLSVLAAYGFLVYLFQFGVGARLFGLRPPGGLNSFIVLMLFTILFGLSMDYEVFLLSRIREVYRAGGDTRHAVAQGLEDTAGIITAAALIMITIFAAFGFTRLLATREFGLGLAFAVALDATLIRIVLVPALMVLAGKRNWWPGRRR